jgi:uncharacterized membrane protein
METSRLEAFSDGVIAIIITIMVLEMKAPHSADIAALGPLVPVLLSYILSFVYVGIYWNNHHHMLKATSRVTGSIMWANLHLLFWLSLIPFVTGWMGQTNFAPLPVALYGVVLLMSGIAFLILQRRIVSNQGPESALAMALGSDFKGKFSPALYAVAIPISFFATWAAGALYVAVALMWLIPDRRYEIARGSRREIG